MSFVKKIKFDFVLFLLIFIIGFLCIQNYTPGTFLSGWDTLHPEFNFKLYLERITSVWQSYQGLGAPPSQAHLAELPRMIIVGLFYLVFSLNFVRYGYFFLMMILGVAGVYFLLKHLTQNRFAAGLSALFYLLNAGTMQHFIVPLEMFATKFGFLGFLYLFAIRFLEKGKKKDLVLFSLVTIFASSMAHTATLWYVYFIGLTLFLGTYSFINENRRGNLKKSVILLLLTVFLNAYWILPNIYYGINYGQDVINSTINRLGSEALYLHNKKYGTISDLVLFKNFLFDWRIIDSSGHSALLLQSWADHLNKVPIIILGWIIFGFSLIGITIASLKKNKVILSFLPIFLICSFFLLSGTPVISFLFESLRNINPLIKETLRFPFTKFSIYYIFCFSIFLGYFFNIFLRFLSRIVTGINPIRLSYLYLYFFVFILLIYAKPAFQGNFISQVVRVKIPNEYFSLFRWSSNQDDGRILTLPIHRLYNWTFYKWDLPEETQIYQGAGFNWFGIKQPTLNREFDRWYPYNEQAYREFSYALYSQNQILFEKLLSKYNINYLLLDENIFIPEDAGQDKKLFYQQTKDLFSLSPQIHLVKKFGDKISVYEFSMTKKISETELSANLEIGRISENRLNQISPAINYSQEIALDYSNLFGNTFDCGFDKPDFSQKKVVFSDQKNSVQFTTSNGNLCERMGFYSLSQNTGYILAIESQNVSGLPLRLCFQNQSTLMCDLEEELTPNKNFKNDYFIIPPHYNGSGYSLVLTNISIGSLKTINRIRTIKLLPFIYEYLQITQPSLIQNNEFILTNNQAFEKNWHVYLVPNFVAKYQALNYLSPILGKELKDHILVKNWKNGWKLDDKTCNTKHETCKIVFVFWPQYLEFIGFGLIIPALLIFLTKFKN